MGIARRKLYLRRHSNEPRSYQRSVPVFGCTCVTQAKEWALIKARVDDTFLACSCMSKLRSFWLFVYLCKRGARGYTRALRLRHRQSLLRRRISVEIASSLPQKIPLLVDFVFTLSTSTACDSGSGQYEAPAMRRMVTCSLSARPATRALRAWSPPCANTRDPLLEIKSGEVVATRHGWPASVRKPHPRVQAGK